MWTVVLQTGQFQPLLNGGGYGVLFFVAIYFSCADPLPNTRLLEMEGDIASELVKGVDRFLSKNWTNRWPNAVRFGSGFDSTPAYAQIHPAQPGAAQETAGTVG